MRFDSISSSPKYFVRSSGFDGGLSLRFPRFVKFREDKKVDQCSTVDDVFNSYGYHRSFGFIPVN